MSSLAVFGRYRKSRRIHVHDSLRVINSLLTQFRLQCLATMQKDTGKVLMNGGTTPKDPSYNELSKTVYELTERLQKFKSTSIPQPVLQFTAVSSVEYHILPDFGTSIQSFTGHESSSQAEHWIFSVDGLAQVNQWPLRHRLQLVRSHISKVPWSWFLWKSFSTGKLSFRDSGLRSGVRCARQICAHLWRELEARMQEPNEPTIDYFYSKFRLCHSLELTLPTRGSKSLRG